MNKEVSGTTGLFLTAGIISIIFFCLAIIISLISLVGGSPLTGCVTRYPDKESSIVTYQQEITVNANGSYHTVDTSNFEESDSMNDPGIQYGQWKKLNYVVSKDDTIDLAVSGAVSLCKAYLPANGVYIPRINESGDGISIVLETKDVDEWYSVAELFINDQVQVSLEESSSHVLVSKEDKLTGNIISGDCSDEKYTYPAVCGKYSIYNGDYIVKCDLDKFTCIRICDNKDGEGGNGCYYHDDETKTDDHIYGCHGGSNCKILSSECTELDWTGVCVTGRYEIKFECEKLIPTTEKLPSPYSADYIFDKNPVNPYPAPYPEECTHEMSLPDEEIKSWYSSTTGLGIVYRTADNNNKSIKDEKFATLVDGRFILNERGYPADFLSDGRGYLQYRLLSNEDSSKNTGGYVIWVKQTKCYRENGAVFSDIHYENRGQIKYLALEADQDPNEDTSLASSAKSLDLDENGKTRIDSLDKDLAYLWFLIDNKKEDYPESSGSYKISLNLPSAQRHFLYEILEPILQTVEKMLSYAGYTIFSNLTCHGIPDKSCTSLFFYIKFMLILYVIIFGIQFLYGLADVSAYDFVIKIIKLGFVGGLLNDNSFLFFTTYVFPYIYKISTDILLSLAGYGNSDGTMLTIIFYPFDEVLSRVFIDDVFRYQIMSLLAMGGFSGIFYFTSVLFSVTCFIIAFIKGFVLYIFCYLGLSIMMGLMPIFLTFLLFEQTRYLFDNLIRFVIRFIFEPIILFSGLILIVELFTIYLDYILGYSVCWKCALSFRLPFPGDTIQLFDNLPIFCLNWFGPWGYDISQTSLGQNITYIVGLMILGYMGLKYCGIAGGISMKLLGMTQIHAPAQK